MYNTAIFILTHGRPNNQRTLKTLQKLNYTGKLYLVLDDQDSTIQQYIDNYGAERIIVFDKNEYVKRTETGLSNPVFKFAVYARNAIEDIAKSMNLDYFIMLDDDITSIRYRYEQDGVLKSCIPRKSFNTILECCYDFIHNTDIACLSFGFSNSYRAGVSVLTTETSRQRHCVIAFIRSTKYEVNWRLNMVEDLITSLDCALKEQMWLQFVPMQIDVVISEGAVQGGNSDAYNDFGKYRLSFFPIVAYPSCNTTRYLNNHWVTTTKANYSCQKIISDRYKRRPI